MPLWAAYRLADEPAEDGLGLLSPERSQPIVDEKQLFHYNPTLWNQTRRDLEAGREPGAPPIAPTIVSSTAPATRGAASLPEEELGIGVELPYESGLSISGRKLIAVKLQEKRYKSPKRAKDLGVKPITRDFEMKQEMQVRIKGKVGRKITVNVDFDDTKEDKRDISVMYQGDPEELVQEAAFGDIVLSLPATEFVSYSKQLFGIRSKLKYKRLQFMAIGSRTKGITETKRFNGNTQLERKEITDAAFDNKQHYRLSFDAAHLPLAVGSEAIYVDDRSSVNNANARRLTVEDYAVSSATFSGFFDRLVPGQDYTVDYARGLVNFRNRQADALVIAVDYAAADGRKLSDLGTPGLLKLIKTGNDQPLSQATRASEVGWQRELKTFYRVGRNKILRDNGRGNFILKTIDRNKNDMDVPLTNGETLRYPDNVEVDFEAGTFNIKPPLQAADSTLYSTSVSSRTPFSFQLEYRYRLKSYLVKPNIVLGSERVLVDGRLLARDLDYFIDYDSGFLTFFNEEEINEYTQVEVTYEYAPFGGTLGQTLVGTRGELSLVPDKMSLGSTCLYTFAPKPTVVPDVRSTPSSLLVAEADTRLDNVKLPWTPLVVNLQAEAAQSRENPNLYGRSLVDSMEGIKQEEQTVMDVDFWQYASNLTGSNVTHPNELVFSDEEIKLSDIVGADQSTKGETQRLLTLDYNLRSSRASIVQSISKAGRDFSKKQFLELWIEGSKGAETDTAGQGVDLWVDIGRFNENADGSAKAGDLPKTEDKNDDATLNQGEDIGWPYLDPGPDGIYGGSGGADDHTFQIGGGNGRIDSEDLDGDGLLQSVDQTPRGRPLFVLSSQTVLMEGTQVKTDLNFSGWKRIQIPLSIASSEEANFQAIKQVRLTLSGNSAGRVRLGKIGFTGNQWEKAFLVAGSSMTVMAANNIDTPGYVRLQDAEESADNEGRRLENLNSKKGYQELYKDQSEARTREQALDLKFSLPAGSTATTRVSFTTARDFSKHEALRFFLRKPSNGTNETFFMQLGTESDYFEYAVPMGAVYTDTWVMEGFDMTDRNDDNIPDEITPFRGTAAVKRVGNPKLTAVGQIKVGVRNETKTRQEGEIWVNEIYLTGAHKKVGNAKRAQIDITWPQWMALGGTYRTIDRNFQTLTSQITNQDKLDESGYFNFNRLRILPLTFNASHALTTTPAAVRTGEAGLVSLLEEGRVESWARSGKGEIAVNKLPRLGFGYDKSLSKNNQSLRVDDKDTYTGSFNYLNPWRLDLLPGRWWALRPLPDSVSANYRRTVYNLSWFDKKRLDEWAVAKTTTAQINTIFNNVRTLEYTDDWSGRVNFAPWNGFSVSPNGAMKTVKEQKRFDEEDLLLFPQFKKTRDYSKSYSQTVGFSSALRVFRWLEPRINFTLSGTETNTLPSVSSPTAYDLKSLDRTADGDAGWQFNARDLLPNFRPSQSLNVNNSYRIESGDSYEKLTREFQGWRKVEFFRKQKVERKNGGKMRGLLTPLNLPNVEAKRKQLTARNTVRSSGNWSPMDWLNFPGILRPLKTINVAATVTNADEHTETTDTIRDAITITWPDFIYTLRDTERFFWLQRWVSNSQATYKTNYKKTEVYLTQLLENRSAGADYRFTLFKRFDLFGSYGRTSLLDRDMRTEIRNSTFTLTNEPGRVNARAKGITYSAQIGMRFGSWRLTPSWGYKRDLAWDGTQKRTTDLAANTYGFKTRFDKSYPEGFRFPFSKKVYSKISRFTLDHNVNYEHKKSALNVEKDNTDIYTSDLTGEYEISRNFRLSFGGGGSVNKNRNKKDENFMTFQLTSQLVIQF